MTGVFIIGMLMSGIELSILELFFHISVSHVMFELR